MSSFATQTVSTQDIYLGFWTNWSYGRVRGATLTLGQRNGGLLLAFLALFATFAEKSFWGIACIVIHHALSSQTSKDGIYHQRQAVLQNAANGSSGLWSLLLINWAWRRHTKSRPYRRNLPLATFTLVIIIAFSLASIFTARISTSMGNEVLLLGSNCATYDVSSADLEFLLRTLLPYQAQRILSSANYALECYQNSTVAQNCPTFVRKSLHWTRDHDSACPFSFPGSDGKICRSNSSNIRLDSGYLDSNSDLGINSPPENRFLYRTVMECGPLNNAGYSKNVTMSTNENGTSLRQVLQYTYGANGRNRSDKITYQYSADPVGGRRYNDGIKSSAAADYILGLVNLSKDEVANAKSKCCTNSSRYSFIAPNGSVLESPMSGGRFLTRTLHEAAADDTLLGARKGISREAFSPPGRATDGQTRLK